MTTWRKEIMRRMGEHGDSWDNIVGTAPDGTDWLDVEFHSGFGGHCGCAFTVWTNDRVYFPIVYDGAEWVGSAPRNPSGEEMRHQGGE